MHFPRQGQFEITTSLEDIKCTEEEARFGCIYNHAVPYVHDTQQMGSGQFHFTTMHNLLFNSSPLLFFLWLFSMLHITARYVFLCTLFFYCEGRAFETGAMQCWQGKHRITGHALQSEFLKKITHTKVMREKWVFKTRHYAILEGTALRLLQSAGGARESAGRRRRRRLWWPWRRLEWLTGGLSARAPGWGAERSRLQWVGVMVGLQGGHVCHSSSPKGVEEEEEEEEGAVHAAGPEHSLGIAFEDAPGQRACDFAMEEVALFEHLQNNCGEIY